MTDAGERPGISIFAGRFGSGKTEVAINYALALARQKANESGHSWPGFYCDGEPSTHTVVAATARVVLVDLDIVTPYFRSRERAEMMRARGVDIVAPSIVGRYLDTPAITPEILGAIQQFDQLTVLDVGGDPQGARALGQYYEAITKATYSLLFVVNPFRPFTGTLEGLATSIEEIEDSSRLRVSCLVSNPNLMSDTSACQIAEGHGKVEAFSRELGLPIAFVAVDLHRLSELRPARFSQPMLGLDRFFVQPWEAVE